MTTAWTLKLQIVAMHRILERADLHDLVGEGVVGTAQPLQVVARALPVRRVRRRDDQHFEVRLVAVAGV